MQKFQLEVSKRRNRKTRHVPDMRYPVLRNKGNVPTQRKFVTGAQTTTLQYVHPALARKKNPPRI